MFRESAFIFAHASSYADGGPDMACWKAKLMVPCDSIFPEVDISVDWSSLENTRLVEGDLISIPSHMVIPDTINLTTTEFKDHGFGIDHTNLHACKVSGGFCSPFVAESPGLVTHSPALRGNAGAHNPVKFDLQLEPGDWTFITHYRFFVDENIRCDFAKGKIVHVEPLLVETVAIPSVITVTTVLSIFGIMVSLMFLLVSYFYRKTNIFKLASWKFCALASLGGVLGNACILLWVPPLTKMTCMMRPFLIPIAFDFIFFPLLLKTWRLKILLVDNAGSLKKVKVSDFMLIKGILLPVCFDVVIATIWTILDRPIPTMVMSLISDNRYEVYCVSHGSVFMLLTLLAKVPFVLWGLKLAWATRAIISVMNESSYIMLSMINLFFVGAYVIVIQFLITDSQSALVMLRCLGTFIAATLTLTIVLGPKLFRLFRYGDVEGLAAIVRRESQRKLSESMSHHEETRTKHKSSTLSRAIDNKYVVSEVPASAGP